MFISEALVPHIGAETYSIMFYASSVLIVISAVLLACVFEEKPVRKGEQRKTSEDENFVRIN